jgi:hypothetical protein
MLRVRTTSETLVTRRLAAKASRPEVGSSRNRRGTSLTSSWDRTLGQPLLDKDHLEAETTGATHHANARPLALSSTDPPIRLRPDLTIPALLQPQHGDHLLGPVPLLLL